MLEQYSPDTNTPFHYQRAAHLLRRIMIGPSDEEIRRAVEEGYNATMQRIFSSFQPDTTLIAEFAGKDPQAAPPPPGSVYDAWFNLHTRHVEDFLGWLLLNILRSPVSLHEKMILFWHRHFPISIVMFAEYPYAYNVMLRKNAFGNFKNMVKDMTMDTLMQVNLSLHDNYVAYGNNFVNENYARELMELYTCGVFDEKGNRNYTQKDVHEAARSLTGWFFGESPLGEQYLGLHSRFLDNRWDSGEKTFLGRTGKWNSFDVIDILFEERAEQIAKRICGKIYRAFVCDTEDAEVVHALARTFLAENWEITPVLKELLGSKHFFDESNVAVLKKSHVEYIMGMMRQLELSEIPDLKIGRSRSGDLIFRLRRWGELMHYAPNVSGWSGGRDWVNVSVLPRRLQFAQDVLYNRLHPLSDLPAPPIYTLQPISFAERFAESDTVADFVDALIRYLLPVEVPEQDIQTVRNALLDGGKEYEWDIYNPKLRADERIRKCLATIATHPSFQLY